MYKQYAFGALNSVLCSCIVFSFGGKVIRVFCPLLRSRMYKHYREVNIWGLE